MASCGVTFNGKKYTQENFTNLLRNGLLFNLLDRKVLDLPINTQGLKDTARLDANFVNSKEDVKKAMVELFGLPEDRAAAVADIYDRVAYAWTNLNKSTKSKFYKTLTFFKGSPNALAKNEELLRQEQVQIRKEIEDVKKSTPASKYMKAPNGKKTNLSEGQWLTVQTPTFKKWFGKSTIVDENGEPQVMFHGTKQVWEEFDNSKGKRHIGLFLTAEPDFAEDYTGSRHTTKYPDSGIMQLFAKGEKVFDYENKKHLADLKKSLPYVHSNLTGGQNSSDDFTSGEDNNWEILERPAVQKFLHDNGYDGYYVKEQGIKNIAVFNGNQVKSTDGTNETFSSDNANIYYQLIGKKGAAKLHQDNVQNLLLAQKLEKDNVSSDKIYTATGWEKGKDGKWNMEIKDGYINLKNLSPLVIDKEKRGGSRIMMPLSKLYDNPTLYKAYPSLKKINVIIADWVQSGEASFGNDTMQLSYLDVTNPEGLQSTIVHEIQHAVQKIEGFANGSNAEDAFEIQRSMQMDALMNGKTMPKDSVHDIYRKVAGEVQARNAEKRFNMTDEERKATPISKTEDVNRKEQLLYQDARAAVIIGENGQHIIYALTNPNVSSPLHELAHVWETQLNPGQREAVLDWAKQDEWTRDTSEKFTRGFEKYLAEGNAPTTALGEVFKQFKEWLTDIYKGLVGSEIDLELNDQMREIYSRMLGENPKAVVQEEIAKEPASTNARTKVDTMERRKAEYVEPEKQKTVQEKLNEQLAEMKEPDKHLKVPRTGQMDFYERVTLIANTFKSGTYEELIKSNEVTEQQLRDIVTGAGLSQALVDKVMFNVNNEGEKYSADNLSDLHDELDTDTISPKFQILSNHFIDSGKLQAAMDNGSLSLEKARDILNSTVAAKSETAETKNKMLELLNKKLGKEKKDATKVTRKVIKEKEVVNQTKVEVAAAPETIVPVETPAPAPVVEEKPAPIEEALAPDVTPESVKEELSTEEGDKMDKVIFSLGNNITSPIMEKLFKEHFSNPENSKYLIKAWLRGIGAKTIADLDALGYIEEEMYEDIVVGELNKAATDPEAYYGAEIESTTLEDKIFKNFDKINAKKGTITETVKEEAPVKTTETKSELDKENERIAAAEARTREIRKELGLDGGEYIVSKSDSGISYQEIPKEHPRAKEFEETKNVVMRVASRMRQFMPSVKMQIGIYDAPWKGRISQGVIQINLNHATIDTPIHEYLHPFVLAMKLANQELYDNLMTEMRYDPDGEVYIETVQFEQEQDESLYANLTQSEVEDEALVRYLADNMKEYFKPGGQVNEKFVDERNSSFIEKFFQWMSELIKKLTDVLSNKTNTINGEQAKSNAGAKTNGIDAMQRVVYNTKTHKLLGYTALSDKVSFTIDSDMLVHSSDFTKRGITEDVFNQLKDYIKNSDADKNNRVEIPVSQLNLSVTPETQLADNRKNGLKDSGERSRYDVDISELPANMSIRDISDLILAQQRIQMDFKGQQLAIDELDAYQGMSNDKADEALARVKKKLVVLHDEAKRRRQNAQLLPTEANAIESILRDYDGVEGVVEYIRRGIDGMALASHMIRYIEDDIDQGNLTEDDVNTLNRDLAEVRTLMGFYNDIPTLVGSYADEFDKKELAGFNSVIATSERRRNKIGTLMTKLGSEWLFPYIEEAQKNLPDDKKLTFEQFQRKFRFADRDISQASYLLGATINQRDPINAILAVAIKDKINEHHVEEIDKLNTIRTTFDSWMKRTGTPNTIKAIEDFYKKNYLRKAKVSETWMEDNVPAGAKVGDTITSNGVKVTIETLKDGTAKVTGLVERWAFHEKYFMDLYQNDYDTYRKTLGEPKTNAEWDNYNNKLKTWVNANNPLTSGNNKYLNPHFATLDKDDYFQLLYKTYKDGNAKYGERQLPFGLVPQAYRKGNLIEGAKNTFKDTKETLKEIAGNKSATATEKLGTAAVGGLNYIFDVDGYMAQQEENLDGSYYRGVKSPFTHVVDTDKLDLRLNESVYGFYTAANTFSSLREVQANVENVKTLIEGNTKLGIEARKITKVDKDGKIIFDRFANKPSSKDRGGRVNTQIVDFINDTFYGVDEFQESFKIGKVNISLNKIGRNLGFFTALNNMAGNVFAGISNVVVGNTMSLGESFGGKYYGVKDWGKAVGIYSANTPQFIADSIRPVKSKITQLAILYDAIQGEFRDKYGKNITGNVAKRYGTTDSFFLLSHMGEHQIQLTGMLALMNATKVKLKDGSEVSLYDAYQPNTAGFYKMRADAIWTKQDENNFTKTLHGISRDLNGNYAAFDKGVIQRHWYGKLALQYRKYLYPAWRSRFSGERVDYERGEVMTGFYRTFLRQVAADIKDMKFNMIKKAFSKTNGFTPEERYANRKTMFDLAVVIGTTILGLALAGMEDDDKDSWAKNALMLETIRLRADMSQYNFMIAQETYKQVKNPSASLQTLSNWAEFIGQLSNPTEEYSQNSGSHERGDSKLGARFEKVVPLLRQWSRVQQPDEQLKFYTITNQDIDKH